MFEIDPIIFDLNDERIHALKNNKIDKSTFLSLRKNDDPWEIRNGTLIYISKEETQRRIIQYTQQYRVGLKKSGGITPTLIYDNSSAFLTVYPELKESLDIAQAAIIKEDCQGCAKNKHLMPVQEKLLTLSPDNRDFTPLIKILEPLPYALKRLKNEEYNTSDAPVNTQMFIKKDIPFINKSEIVSTISILPDNPLGITRDSCMSCVQKHLSRAYILMIESMQGYSAANGFINESMLIAHLGEAEEEAIKENPVLASKIRSIRLSLTGQTVNAK